jgi:glutamate racemase
MVSKPLLFYDSGAGGLPYLTAARACLPAERYIYLADRKNFPLGEKAEELVRQVVLESVSLAVERFAPRLVVIACNTASVVALQVLREHFSIPFVGVVPAVKPAALSLAGGILAVVSTRQTASGPYLDKLIQEFSDGREVIKIPVANLVDFAEYRYLSADPGERLASVRQALAPLLRQEVQAVVLGCTHFVLLEQEFRTVLTDRVALIDSREGVTRRIVSLLAGGSAEPADRGDAHRAPEGSVESGSAETRPDPTEGAPPARLAQLAKRAELYLHGGEEEQERYRAFARHFGLRYCGLLEDAGR